MEIELELVYVKMTTSFGSQKGCNWIDAAYIMNESPAYKAALSDEMVPRLPANHVAINLESMVSIAGSQTFLDLCAQRPLSSSLQKFYCDVCTFDILVHPEESLRRHPL